MDKRHHSRHERFDSACSLLSAMFGSHLHQACIFAAVLTLRRTCRTALFSPTCCGYAKYSWLWSLSRMTPFACAQAITGELGHEVDRETAGMTKSAKRGNLRLVEKTFREIHGCEVGRRVGREEGRGAIVQRRAGESRNQIVRPIGALGA